MASTAVKVVTNALFKHSFIRFQSPLKKTCSSVAQRHISPKTGLADPGFGLFFDIDGVIIRGREVLPHAREAFQLLTDRHGKFWIPTIFVTNAGNMLRQKKAMQLSEFLNIEILQEQVVMSHSPLKMFRQFLDKHVLVSGQGPALDIAKFLGFTKITTIETLRQSFPTLDMVDHKRRKTDPCDFQKYFPRIEAVIMFGEPVRWETNLQLILDVLLTNGYPTNLPTTIPHPHIPVLACNMDLVWMAESNMPRLGHGCFMHCLETLYKKLSGHELKYTALLGKPSTLTYYHAEHVLQLQARQLGYSGLDEIYCIGDNPDVDIYGANLFNHTLQRRKQNLDVNQSSCSESETCDPCNNHSHNTTDMHNELNSFDGAGPSCMSKEEREILGVKSCKSVLVCTGVFNGNNGGNVTTELETSVKQQKKLNHRDCIMDSDLRIPDSTVPDVLQAVKSIFTEQKIAGFS